jgi:hypothetical protein
MPLNFPNSPVLNQTTTVNGRTYQWNGTAWNLVTYTLPVASTSSQGSVQIVDGGGINVSASGNISSIGAQLYLWANFR